MKVRTPKDIANAKAGKDKFTLYLSVARIEDLKKEANKAKVSVSQLVDEAIFTYLSQIKDRKND